MPDKEEGIEGIRKDIHFDDKRAVLDIDLVKVSNNEGGYFRIDLNTEDESILKLHIQEAIELKSVIDSLVFSAVTNSQNKQKEED